MEELKIELTFDPAHFREIYFQNGQGSMFTYKHTLKPIIWFFAFILFDTVIYLLSYQWPNVSWLLLPGVVSLLFIGIYVSITITQYLRWKAGSNEYIKELAKYKSFSLHLTSAAITFTQDSKTSIDKWDSIRSAKIFDNYLMQYIEIEPAYIIPAKSMKQAEFIKLKDFITDKLKNAVEG